LANGQKTSRIGEKKNTPLYYEADNKKGVCCPEPRDIYRPSRKINSPSFCDGGSCSTKRTRLAGRRGRILYRKRKSRRIPNCLLNRAFGQKGFEQASTSKGQAENCRRHVKAGREIVGEVFDHSIVQKFGGFGSAVYAREGTIKV